MFVHFSANLGWKNKALFVSLFRSFILVISVGSDNTSLKYYCLTLFCWNLNFCNVYFFLRKVLRKEWERRKRGWRWAELLWLCEGLDDNESWDLLWCQMEQRGPAYLTTGQFTPHALGGRDQPEAVQNARYKAFEMRKQSMEQHNKVQLPCLSGSLT